MGYHTLVRGEIKISPPLLPEEYLTSPFRAEAGDPYYEKTVRLENGGSLVPYDEDKPFKAYTLVADITGFIAHHGAGRRIEGTFTCQEEDGTNWRAEVKCGRVLCVYAAEVWPEDLALLKQAIHSGDAARIAAAAVALVEALEKEHYQQR